MEVLINVDGQKLKMSTNLKSYVAGSQEFVKFIFNTSEDWNDLIIFAQFQQNGKAYSVYLDDENSVFLPAEIVSGKCLLMLYGSNSTTIGTTEYLTLLIDENMIVADTKSTIITEPLYNQLVDKVDGIGKRVDNIVIDGTTTDGNAELIDIRLGIDGIKYISAGESVREQTKQASESGNVLYGKKIVTCGDGYTQGNFTDYTDSNNKTLEESDAYDKDWKCYKTYPWWIAKRNNMTLINEAKRGSIFALSKDYVSGSQPITYKNPFANERYKAIPSDTDYITLWFGANDDTYTELGTIDDTDNKTFYGAWNVVLEYLITNIPNAKIGIIVPPGCKDNFREALRDIALKWAIPFLDMVGDESVPLIFEREAILGTDSKVQILRRNAFYVSEANKLPNLKAHEYMSTFIENWLRSL